MTEIDILTQKVKDGLIHHQYATKLCDGCPYKCGPMPFSCSSKLAEDALKVINYWKGKYENTVLQQPMMILNTNQHLMVDPIDIRTTLKEAKAMGKMADAANKAADALNKATEALRELNEELKDEPPKIPEAVTAEWTYIETPLGCSVWIGQCTHCGKVTTMAFGKGRPKVCPHCKAVMTGVE